MPKMVHVLIYLYLEIIPEWQRRQRGNWNRPHYRPTSNKSKKVQSNLQTSLPTEIISLQEELVRCDSVDNRAALADAYAVHGDYRHAMTLYGQCLVGIYAEDPILRFKYAQAAFECKDYPRAIEATETLLNLDGADLNQVLLLRARSYEFLQRFDQARVTYFGLMEREPNLLAQGHYARFLIERGDAQSAQPLLEKVLKNKQSLKTDNKEEQAMLRFAKQNYRKR